MNLKKGGGTEWRNPQPVNHANFMSTIFTKRWNRIKLWSSAKENSQFLVSRALLDLTILKAMQVVLVRDPVQDITSFVAHFLQ
jgi:hypothetical protein